MLSKDVEINDHFITSSQEYKEGNVFIFEQPIDVGKYVSAELQITALGVYEAEFNGNKVGDFFLAPGFTYYPLHLNTQTYDVTNLINKQSVLRVYLGQGWYCGRFTHENINQIYGENSAVSWILKIILETGEVKHYCSSDKNVKLLSSPYKYAGLYDGEIYDANIHLKENDNYSKVKYTGKLPETIKTTIDYPRIQEEMEVDKVIYNDNKVILDFGQNFSGIIEIDPTKLDLEELKVKHGEVLNTDGSLYTTNLRKAKAEIVYKKGETTDIYRPRFTYMGFRYIELSMTDYVPGLIKAYTVYNKMKRTGQFFCENELVNKLYENQVWGQKSNYIEVPMDCPQRDERMGYTGDGQVFAMTGSYNFDTERFWEKYLLDITYTQQDNEKGYVPPTVPANGPTGIGYLNMLGWGNCVMIVPELLYRQYGNLDHVINQYDSMKKFVECEIEQMGDDYLWLGINLGDWLMMGKDVAWMAQNNNPVSNSFIVNDLRIMTWAAKILGKEYDYKRYNEIYHKVRNSYINKFIDNDGYISENYQGAYILALQYVVPEGSLWNKVFRHLVNHINEHGMQTGFFGTEYILPILIKGNEYELAYDLLLNEECPGWMYQVKLGATTTWERWDAIKPDGTINEIKLSDDNMVSFNHYAFGSVGRFYYEHILGIYPLKSGFEEILIEPIIDSRLGKVSGSFICKTGEIKVCWEDCNDVVKYELVVPTNSRFVDINKQEYNLKKGKYEISVKKGMKNEI